MSLGSGILKNSGSVKFSEIANVYGYSLTNTSNIKLGDYYKNGTYVTSSREIFIPNINIIPKPSLSVSQLMGRSPRIRDKTTVTFTEIAETYISNNERAYKVLTPNSIGYGTVIKYAYVYVTFPLHPVMRGSWFAIKNNRYPSGFDSGYDTLVLFGINDFLVNNNYLGIENENDFTIHFFYSSPWSEQFEPPILTSIKIVKQAIPPYIDEYY